MTTSDAHYRLGRVSSAELDTARPDDWLSASEAAAYAGLRTDKRRRDWLAGRIAAKRLFPGIEPRCVEIRNDPDGAPRARIARRAAPEEFPISISHSASGAVAALPCGGPAVGVDLERAEPRDESFLPIMAHAAEIHGRLAQDAVEQTRLWTAKEAVSKFLGVGLSVDLWDIRFIPEGSARRLELHGRAKERWTDLGSPEIGWDTFVAQGDVLSVAYAASAGPRAERN